MQKNLQNPMHAMLCYAMRDYDRVTGICKILLRYCYRNKHL